MLEMFFDNEKSFSVFKYLIESNDYVKIKDLRSDLNLTFRQLRKVIDDFELLNMIDFSSSSVSVKLNEDNPVVIGVSILDELVEKYYMRDAISERDIEVEDFQKILEGIDVNSMSIQDFIKLLNKIEV